MADSYCTVENVQNLTRWDYAASDTSEVVDENDVQGYIDQIAGEINGVLSSKGIDIASIGSTDSKQLTLYNTLGAACLAESAMVRESEEPKRVERWCKQYEAALKKLKDNPKMLLGIEISSADGLARFRTEDVGEKKFHVDDNSQW